MDITSTFSLFIAMILLALIPGPGVLLVAARTLTGGLKHGVFTAAGIVVGDYLFILLAIFGLSAIASLMGSLFFIVKYVGAIYLIWLGIQLIRSKEENTEIEAATASSYRADFISGMVTTLGNPKAILFYLSFFPTFLNMASLSTLDVMIIMLTATITIGGVMLSYAYTASKAKGLLKGNPSTKGVRYTSGGILVASGAFLAAKS